MSKEKLKAAAKVAHGAAQIVGGVAAAAGKGVVGTCLANHNMMRMAQRYGVASVKNGKRKFDEGVKDWERASS